MPFKGMIYGKKFKVLKIGPGCLVVISAINIQLRVKAKQQIDRHLFPFSNRSSYSLVLTNASQSNKRLGSILFIPPTVYFGKTKSTPQIDPQRGFALNREGLYYRQLPPYKKRFIDMQLQPITTS